MARATLATPAELKLIEASANGEIMDFSAIDPTANNPADGALWTADRTLSAAMLRMLLTRTNPAWSLRSDGVRVGGARIAGELNLADTDLDFPIAFVRCSFEQELSLRCASVDSVFLGGSDLPGIDACDLNARGGIQLCDGFRALGPLHFDRATIGGDFSCNGAILHSHARLRSNRERCGYSRSCPTE